MRITYSRLPDPEALEGMPELAALVQEHAETLAAWRSGKTEYEQLQKALAEARERDERAAADAYRAGEKVPGRRHEKKVLEAIEELGRRTNVRARAFASVEADIARVVAEHRDRWLPKVERAIEKDNRRLASLLEQVRAIQESRQQHRGVRKWLSESAAAAYSPEPYQQGGLPEDVALTVLEASLGREDAEASQGAA